MILIGKTANCLLGAYVIAHSAVLKAVDKFVRMREITRSVKVALKCLIAVVLVDDDFPYWTSKVEHLVAFTTIFSNICTARALKRLYMNFRCKFRHRCSICRPRFPIRVQNFGDLATLSVDFCILYAGCPPYFYFQFVWPTDLESIPHASTPMSIIPTKFEVDNDTLPSYSIFVCWYVTWPWPWLLTFWHWTVAMHGGSCHQTCYQVWRP